MRSAYNPAAEVTEVEIILECLRAYLDHRTRQPPDDEPLKMLTWADLIRPVRADEMVRDIVADPVRHALRGRVREIGMMLHADGGVAEMQRVCDEVEDMGGAVAILDKWWDGIGCTADSPGWCA